jgi:hypothetical protein
MAKISTFFGAMLIGLGIASYFGSGMSSATALIPVPFGLLLLGMGSWAQRAPHKTGTAMHIAAAVGLLGLVAPLSRVIPTLASGGEMGFAFWINVAMALICAVFTVLAVRSFIAASKARKAGQANASMAK